MKLGRLSEDTDERADLNITPLIDIVFILLIFFVVTATFVNELGVDLPRTTEELAREGERVDRSELQAGDLVFFKTGFRQRHVGIYMGGKRFLHASTSRGVMTSSLNNVYWKERYWKARRIELEDQPAALSVSDESR